MKRVFSTIIMIVVVMVFLALISLIKFGNINKKIRVNVKVDRFTNEVDAIQLGDHGSFVPLDQIIKEFDINKDKKVTLNEFQGSISKINKNWKKSSSPVKIKLNNGMTVQDVEKMLAYMDTAKQYLASLSKIYNPPKIISLGNNGKGDYYNSATNEMHFSSINQDSITQKIFQKYIIDNYSKLDYTAVEAYARYFANQIIGNFIERNNMYDQNLASLNGSNIYNQDIEPRIVANNNLALTQALFGINSDIVWRSLQNLNNCFAGRGADYKNAVLDADRQITGGQNKNKITSSFNNHGF